MYIGCHLSFSKGYFQMAKEALSIGSNAIQYFSRNPRGGAMKAFDADDAKKMLDITTSQNFAPFLLHAPYVYNTCALDDSLRTWAITSMREDLQRQQLIPNSMYVFHPGSHVKQGIEVGIEKIAKALDEIIFDDIQTTVLLEGMSGKGSEMGRSFQELKDIIDATKWSNKIGVCLDTCHLYSAGYDIVGNLDAVIDEFDKIVGLNKLKAIHLNDSMTPLASNKDRHECIGKGTIGLDALVRIINHPKLRNLPFYLETPNELDGYKQEIALLRSKRID